MTKRILTLLAAASACVNTYAETTNAHVTFYFVSKRQIEGGQMFDRFPFPHLGYIANTPDLTVDRIKEVTSLPENTRSGWTEDRICGTTKPAKFKTAERFFFTLRDEDAAELKRFAGKAGHTGQLVLALLGDKPVSLLRPDDIAVKAHLEIIGNWGPGEAEAMAGTLRGLVSTNRRAAGS